MHALSDLCSQRNDQRIGGRTYDNCCAASAGNNCRLQGLALKSLNKSKHQATLCPHRCKAKMHLNMNVQRFVLKSVLIQNWNCTYIMP